MAADPDNESLHRIFADFLVERGEDAEAEYHRTWTIKVRAEEWLRNFARDVDADYDEMMSVAKTHCKGHGGWEDYLNEGGKWEGEATPPEFWTHYTILTGGEPNMKYGPPGIFSCSC